MVRVGILGGTGFAPAQGEPIFVETPFGDVEVRHEREGALDLFLLSRHGSARLPAHPSHSWGTKISASPDIPAPWKVPAHPLSGSASAAGSVRVQAAAMSDHDPLLRTLSTDVAGGSQTAYDVAVVVGGGHFEGRVTAPLVFREILPDALWGEKYQQSDQDLQAEAGTYLHLLAVKGPGIAEAAQRRVRIRIDSITAWWLMDES